jgi:hypothetical protein
MFNWSVATAGADVDGLIAGSQVPTQGETNIEHSEVRQLDGLLGDAYGVQHHGGDSPQAIQSVAVHLLNIHAIVQGRSTRAGWAIQRALRTRGVFHKLQPPPLGSAMTIRHLFPGGGVAVPITRSQYVASVYETWMALHRAVVEQWYEQHVARE